MGKILLIILSMICMLTGYTNAGELSRDEAAAMIKEVIANEKQADITRYYQKYGPFYYIGSDNGVINKHKELEQGGYVKVRALSDSKTSSESKTTYGIQFTDKALPYMAKNNEDSENKAYITLAKVDNIDVIGLKKLTPNEYKAEVSLGYRLTPFGEILLGRGIKVERKEDALFEAHDNGWRVKFKVNF
ncbi:MAG: hypothetical protein NTU69_04175 [Proteobacteria bacterium]|nr:hypothetical protein [Pseudomonadota bacterium]